MQPLVTVVMAVFNGEAYLAEAIESLLAQSYPRIEIILVDDGSSDQTSKIAQKYPLAYLGQKNQGQPAATNRGIEAASGTYITFLDADDIYLKDKISTQVEFLEKNPLVDFVFGSVVQFFSPELKSELEKKWVCPPEITPGHLAAAALFRRGCFEKVGLFNEEQKIGVFIEWYMRACETGLKNELISNLALQRRIHNNNMGVHAQNMRHEYIKIVKEALKRRGAFA